MERHKGKLVQIWSVLNLAFASCSETMTSSTGLCVSDWHRVLSFSRHRGWSSPVEIQSRPAWQRRIYAQPCTLLSMHTYIVLPSAPRETHTCHTWDERAYVFPEKPIFSSQESTTGGTWCYINAPCFSLLVLLVLGASPFTFLPIGSSLLEYNSPAKLPIRLGLLVISIAMMCL